MCNLEIQTVRLLHCQQRQLGLLCSLMIIYNPQPFAFQMHVDHQLLSAALEG